VADQVEAFGEVEACKRRHKAVLILIIDLVDEVVFWPWSLQPARIINDDMATSEVMQRRQIFSADGIGDAFALLPAILMRAPMTIRRFGSHPTRFWLVGSQQELCFAIASRHDSR
jgi:hypothetical protein